MNDVATTPLSKRGKCRSNRLKTNDFIFLNLFLVGSLMFSQIIDIFGPDATLFSMPDDASFIDLNNETQVCHVSSDNIEHMTVYSPPIPYCFNHLFVFDHIWTQYFSLDMIVHRKSENLDQVKHFLNLNIIWNGTNTYLKERETEGWLPYEGIAKQKKLHRTVTCNQGEKDCESSVLFRTKSVTYEKYFFQLYLNKQLSTLNSEWVETISFIFEYRNYLYSIYELAFKSFFAMASIFSLANYATSYFSTFGDRTNNQRWVLVLHVALVFFDEPLYFLNYTGMTKASYIHWISVLLQGLFVCLLCLYWLSVFKKLVDKTYESTNIFQHLEVESIITFIAFTYGGCLYCIIKSIESLHPLFDWDDDDEILSPLVRYGAIFFISLFLICLTYRIIAAIPKLIGLTNQHKAVTFIHIGIIVLLFLSLLMGYFYSNEAITDTPDFIFYNALYNSYIIALGYIYQPLPPNGKKLVKRGSYELSSTTSTTTGRVAAAASGSPEEGRSGSFTYNEKKDSPLSLSMNDIDIIPAYSIKNSTSSNAIDFGRSDPSSSKAGADKKTSSNTTTKQNKGLSAGI